MHPLDVQRYRDLYLGAIRHGPFMELEFRVPRRDGEVRWMYMRGDCKCGADGAAVSYLGVMMEEALRDTDRRKDEFLATLAHELRNPLAPIHNGLAVLRRSAANTAESAKIHIMLERQMSHIIRLVDDLLDVSRYTLGKIQLKRSAVDLQTVVQNAVDMSRPLIDAARHHLDVSVPPELVVLQADGVRLAQVLANLLNNSAKYTAEGGRLWLSASLQGDRAVISVRDTGVGIPESMLDRVFDLFTQLESDGSGGRPGLGIGLAMVRMLVDLHGGEVEARSSGPGQGSEFIVRLPLSPERHTAAPNADAGTPDTPLSGHRVLVVDDNYDSAASLGMLLTLAGADVHVTNDGASALKAMPDYLPDIVLLDIGMPGMDGYTVASRIREDARYRDVTLIALTGFGQEQDRVRSMAAGFNHHMTKPLDLSALQTLLASVQPARSAKPAERGS
jgi:signal transduction histidine kinase/CheY-like chemotaxis protein